MPKTTFWKNPPRFENLLSWEKPNYERIWTYQRELVDKIAAGEAQETILVCEHELCATMGRRAQQSNILSSIGMPIHEIERGGDVTLHAPGQLVIYPLLKLKGERFPGGLHEYLRFLEEWIITFLKDLNLDAGRYGPTGVWVNVESSASPRKIASIGISVRRWVTYHGIALNVSNDLKDFERIRPCDFDASVMTSLSALGHNFSLEEVMRRLQGAK